MQIKLASRVSAIPDQVSCDLSGEAAVLSLRSGIYYGLNPVGARIWTLVQKPVIVTEILQTIVAEYEVDASVCEADLMQVLGDLATHGLLEVV